MLEKPKINFIIDSLMFFIMMPLTGIGFLMKFVLIPGKERMAVYGRNVDLLFLGLDRHEWGTIHLCIAYILGALLAVHIALHFLWISNVLKQLIANRRMKLMAATAFILFCIALLLFPFMVKQHVQDVAHDKGYSPHQGKGYGLHRGKGMMMQFRD